LIDDGGSGLIGSPRSPSTLDPRGAGPWSFSSTAAPVRLSRAPRPSTLRLPLPFRVLPIRAPAWPAAPSGSWVMQFPLMEFGSLQRSPAQRVRFSPGIQPGHDASSEFGSLDALLPFGPSDHFWPGRSWDFRLQGLAPAGDPGVLSDTEPSWCCPTRSPNASNLAHRTRNPERVMTPLGCPGEPPSGPCSHRQAVPACRSIRALTQAVCPPGFHPP
jgi:hypothetical protein